MQCERNKGQLVHERQRENSRKEFSGLILELSGLEVPRPELPVPEFHDTVNLEELFDAPAKAHLRLCLTASEFEETLVRVNIGLDVRPGM